MTKGRKMNDYSKAMADEYGEFIPDEGGTKVFEVRWSELAHVFGGIPKDDVVFGTYGSRKSAIGAAKAHLKRTWGYVNEETIALNFDIVEIEREVA